MASELNAEDPYIRQKDLFNPADHPSARVTFVGCGGIGSFAALAVAKLGVPNIVLIDHDEVEAHNIPNQMFTYDDADGGGITKVAALSELIGEFSAGELNVGTYIRELGDLPRTQYNGVVVSGLDSMEARQELWTDKIKLNPAVPLLIDARIGGPHIVIYTVNPLSLEACDKYETTLHSDDEGMSISCTARGIIDVGFIVGGLIANLTRKHFARSSLPEVTYLNADKLTIESGDLNV